MAVYESIAFNVNRLNFMSSVTGLFLDYIASVVSCKSLFMSWPESFGEESESKVTLRAAVEFVLLKRRLVRGETLDWHLNVVLCFAGHSVILFNLHLYR